MCFENEYEVEWESVLKAGGIKGVLLACFHWIIY